MQEEQDQKLLIRLKWERLTQSLSARLPGTTLGGGFPQPLTLPSEGPPVYPCCPLTAVATPANSQPRKPKEKGGSSQKEESGEGGGRQMMQEVRHLWLPFSMWPETDCEGGGGGVFAASEGKPAPDQRALAGHLGGYFTYFTISGAVQEREAWDARQGHTPATLHQHEDQGSPNPPKGLQKEGQRDSQGDFTRGKNSATCSKNNSL
ncbi:uncharacterized protein LOC125115136 [Phacochoerus africanus]|uniref:uncharacterized protein LOC125115136 n=1 Tax=Phacochoerus africanus TaxID=41426 RepID=UPI001FD8F1C7|nr:uncharacterized protein LOC125115136 [Phacochoerus africanus]